ncbi:MAG TPA: transglycosylase SLT domain-containing protein [Caulobacteraceae bacterium]|nr:transglycosylase SLT domain-containing protein [Caulobacteraceae bacterium]
MDVDSIRSVVEGAIQRASAVTGVDFTFLLGTARRESAFNPTAHARTSSAAGLFQFLDQTWLSTLKQHGAKYGYARYAALIQQAPDGRYFVEGAEARKAVMDLKLDPHAAALMAGELASDHASYLRGRMGRDPTPGELYAAHVLGPKGSATLIDTVRSNPSATAAPLFPEAAAANRGLFYRDGRAVSVGELYADLTRDPTAGPVVATVASARVARPAAAVESFTQYATARRIDREAQEQALIDLVLRGPEQSDDSRTSLAQSMFSDEMLRALTTARGER